VREIGQEEFVPAGPLAYRRQTSISFGAAGRFSSTKEEPDRISSLFSDIYGGDRFGQILIYSRFNHEGRDIIAHPSKGTTLEVFGAYVPAVWDAKSQYGFVDAVGSAYVSAPLPLQPVLALRAGGKKIWGDFPYFDAAFIGGSESLRGYDRDRFAGDVSAYGGADLRFGLLKPKFLLMSNFGLFGFVDAGRIWLDGESPGDWYTAYGGGLWASFIGRPTTGSLGVAFGGEDKVKIYVWWGFAF
jgi:outer membrane translocation and assembly module TamA